jgi:N-acyl homoserine lactone hydrolase
MMRSAAPRGRVLRLHILDFGLFDVGPGVRTIGIPGFLLETDRGERILFDTGFPPDYATAPGPTAARDGLARFGALIGFSARQTAAGQLALLGLAPADVTHVIVSHGHIDHVGSLPLFAARPVWMTRTERADPKPCYFFDVRPMDWPAAAYHLIDAPTELCPGLSLIPTPGHTAGHLSALVTLPSGRSMLLAADAINRASEPDEGFPDAGDRAAAARSAQTLFAVQAKHDAMLIYGHDPAQWPGLRKAPAFYD